MGQWVDGNPTGKCLYIFVLTAQAIYDRIRIYIVDGASFVLFK
jgi:hypothetical protein